MCYDTEPDFKDHDPHNINGHIKIKFSDVLAEPDEFRSCDCIWQGADCCFGCMASICYGLPVGLCHLFISMGWGMEMGVLLFYHVWLASPFLHCFAYLAHMPASCFRLCTRCLLDPCCEACSYIFMFCRRSRKFPDWDKEQKGGKSDWQPLALF